MNENTENSGKASNINLLRIDLQESLLQSAIDVRKLSAFQRILLTTDGTVTEILEAQLGEAIKIVKVFQDNTLAETSVPYLNIGVETPILIRKVLLRGKYTHKNYIYAESIIVPDNLDKKIRDGLILTEKPIGQLILQNRLETFREILNCRKEPASELSQYFNIEPDSQLISRTYRIFAAGKPIMLITEKFPESTFLD